MDNICRATSFPIKNSYSNLLPSLHLSMSVVRDSMLTDNHSLQSSHFLGLITRFQICLLNGHRTSEHSPLCDQPLGPPISLHTLEMVIPRFGPRLCSVSIPNSFHTFSSHLLIGYILICPWRSQNVAVRAEQAFKMQLNQKRNKQKQFCNYSTTTTNQYHQKSTQEMFSCFFSPVQMRNLRP